MRVTDLEYLISRWDSVRAGLLATIGKFEDRDLDFRPRDGLWSARQIMLHVVQEENGEFNFGLTQTLPEFPPEYDTAGYPNRAAVLALLEAVHAPNVAHLRGLTDADLARVIDTPWGARPRLVEVVDHLVEHEIHHRAELSLVLGLLGRAGFDA